MTSDGRALASASLRNLLALAASIPIVALPLFGLWVHRFLKDYRTGIYAAAFVVALGIAMHVGFFRVREGSVRLGSAAWRGAIAGYLAGLIAYFALVLATPSGAEGLSRVLSRDPEGSAALVASFPLVFGGWVYGALVGVAVEWLRGKAEASRLP